MVNRVPHLHIVLPILALLLLLVIPAGARAADATVLVGDFYFQPQDVTIGVGESVTWVIKKGFHTTTNGTGDSDPQSGTLWDALVFSGEPTSTYTFASPGTYAYFCRFHELLDMRGTVTVTAPTATQPTSWGAVKSLYR